MKIISDAWLVFPTLAPTCRSTKQQSKHEAKNNAESRRTLRCAPQMSTTLAPIGNGDRLVYVNLPHFDLRDLDTIPLATVMIANPRAGHFLVGEEKEIGKFSRAGCVGLWGSEKEFVPVSRDEDIRKKVLSFINQYDTMEFGHVKIWPEMEPLNSSYFSFARTSNHKDRAPLKPREAIRLTGPSGPPMLFPVFVAPPFPPSPLLDVTEGVHSLDSEPLCVGLARFGSLERARYSLLSPAMVYLPHAHTCDDNRAHFTSECELSGEDLQLFKERFMRAHDEGQTRGHITREELRESEKKTLALQFPKGVIFGVMDLEDSPWYERAEARRDLERNRNKRLY